MLQFLTCFILGVVVSVFVLSIVIVCKEDKPKRKG